MPGYNAIDEVYAGDFGDNSMPIDCADTANVCTIGTDFIFDALNPACYAAGVLPSVGALPVAGLVNLARDAAPALSRTLPVTAIPTDVSNLPVFDGTGLVFAPTTQLPLLVRKSGAADNLVCSPADEGFLDFLHSVCFRLTAAPISTAATFAMAGNSATNAPNSGFKIASNLSVSNVVTGASIGTATLNTTIHLAALYRFNVGAGTSTIQNYWNGIPVGAPIVGRATASYLASYVNSKMELGGGSGLAVPTGKLYRVVRELVNVASVNVDAYVAADYAYCAPRFTS